MSMTPETPTPETDAAARRGAYIKAPSLYYETHGKQLVHIDDARRLERERDAALAEIESMRAAIQEAHKIIEVLYMDALDNHKESWPRANEWMQKHAALAKLKPFIKP